MPPAISPPSVSTAVFSSIFFFFVTLHCLSQVGCYKLDQHLAHQARFTRTRNAGYAGEYTQRNFNIKIPEVIARNAPELQPATRLSERTIFYSLPFHRKDTTGSATRSLLPVRPAGRCRAPPATGFTGGWSDVDDPVRMADNVQLVLDNKYRVACGLQSIERTE